MQGQLWIEVLGELIVARVRGAPTKELLRECQQQVLVAAVAWLTGTARQLAANTNGQP